MKRSLYPELSSRLHMAQAALQAHARPEQLAAMRGFAMSGDNRLGVAVPVLRQLGRQFGPDHELALALWDSDVPDARILASLLAEPARLSRAEMDHWVAGMQAWDVCDQACLNAFRRSPLAWELVPAWAAQQPEFVRRAGFALLAVLAVHDKQRGDADFLDRLPLIAAAADDERNFVKKAVNWALRQIGKRNAVLREAAIDTAGALCERPEASSRWIGRDALRELRGKARQG
ncbi:DNA alkylation repair protein [Paucibacter sp. APW11]|uniref:DNA alkylation repair protein n=1 Tax=Roseateles aquae TaxID=3077235 RepID=A0ABU3PGA4_9BURK|nr:DNA alkylation repair protein [Paucibacter sp. APW11]MDT9001624.1 DNA alkylation repair protein [Paucibacter sp. APW11]